MEKNMYGKIGTTKLATGSSSRNAAKNTSMVLTTSMHAWTRSQLRLSVEWLSEWWFNTYRYILIQSLIIQYLFCKLIIAITDLTCSQVDSTWLHLYKLEFPLPAIVVVAVACRNCTIFSISFTTKSMKLMLTIYGHKASNS